MTKLGQVWDECPSKWLSRQGETMMHLRDQRYLKRYGVMPRAGGLLDQDPRFIEAVEIIDGATARVQEKAARIAHAQAEAGSRAATRRMG